MRVLLSLALVLALTIPAGAAHCVTYSTSAAEVDAGGIYVDNDFCYYCLFSIWIYSESNGIPGLQRADEVVDDTCHGMIAGDTVIF